MFTKGDIIQCVYAYEQYSTKPYRHREISDTALFLAYHADGKANVLRTDGREMRCSLWQLRLCVSVHDAEYRTLRDLVFPEQHAAALSTPQAAPERKVDMPPQRAA